MKMKLKYRHHRRKTGDKRERVRAWHQGHQVKYRQARSKQYHAVRARILKRWRIATRCGVKASLVTVRASSISPCIY